MQEYTSLLWQKNVPLVGAIIIILTMLIIIIHTRSHASGILKNDRASFTRKAKRVRDENIRNDRGINYTLRVSASQQSS